MKVSDCNISDEFLTCDVNDSVSNLAKTMKQKDFLNQVIVLEQKKPVGVISTRDIVERVVAEDKNPSLVKAKEIMTSPIVSVMDSDDIESVANLMKSKRFLSLPVVNSNQEFLGVVTVYDVLKKTRKMVIRP